MYFELYIRFKFMFIVRMGKLIMKGLLMKVDENKFRSRK